MSYPVLVLVLAALGVLLGVCLYLVLSKKRALQEALQITRKELEKYALIRDVDAEVSERRRKLEEEITNATRQINTARRELEAEISQKRQEAESDVSSLNARLLLAQQELAEIQARLQEYQLKLDMEEMGFYQPKFKFEDSLQYAEALDLIREAQKELIRQPGYALDSPKRTAVASDASRETDTARDFPFSRKTCRKPDASECEAALPHITKSAGGMKCIPRLDKNWFWKVSRRL